LGQLQQSDTLALQGYLAPGGKKFIVPQPTKFEMEIKRIYSYDNNVKGVLNPNFRSFSFELNKK